ncbi:MAG: nicotinamide phosphoribosyltransferase domain-containing protein [bacterium]|nr:nicotinamide phosphoribosyltransferase domain-containing protein [bacterium]
MLVQRISTNYQAPKAIPIEKRQLMTMPSFKSAIPREVPPELWQIGKSKELQELAFNLKTLACKTPEDFRALFLRMKELTNQIGEKAGFSVIHKTPRMVQTDAYYVSSNFYIHPDAKDHSVYQIAFRREELPWMKDMGVKPEEHKLIFHGLQDIIEDTLHDPVTKEEIEDADNFYKTARNGWNFKWDRGMWEKILADNNGIIPIKIEALKDGSTVFPGEPVIQITADDGYGELAAWFETRLLQVWSASERASMLRHWLEYNKNMIRETSDANLTEEEIISKAQKMLVDFSDRSSMCPQESERMGKASMTVFPIQSTMSAVYQAAKDNNGVIPGSIAMPSLPHRVIESYEKEPDAFNALYNYTKGGLGSYVVDCYNSKNAVKEYILPLAKKAQQENKALGINTVINARPDSGDPYEEVKYILDLAVENGLYREIKTRGGRVLKGMTVLKALQADGMNFKKMMDINNRLIEAGYSPADCLSYGVGGYLHDAISRSNMSAACKLAEIGKGERERAVMKCPKGEPVKESIPGAVKLVREENSTAPTVRRLNEDGENAYIVWYDGINGHGIEYKENFSDVQKRVLEGFDKYEKPQQLYSDGILEEKARVRELHHGSNN